MKKRCWPSYAVLAEHRSKRLLFWLVETGGGGGVELQLKRKLAVLVAA